MSSLRAMLFAAGKGALICPCCAPVSRQRQTSRIEDCGQPYRRRQGEPATIISRMLGGLPCRKTPPVANGFESQAIALSAASTSSINGILGAKGEAKQVAKEKQGHSTEKQFYLSGILDLDQYGMPDPLVLTFGPKTLNLETISLGWNQPRLHS